MKKNTVRTIAICAVMGAVGFILMALEFSVPFLIPGFIKFDFSELPSLITSFSLGPWYGVLVCLIKNLLHLPMTNSAGVGELTNFFLGSVFSLVCGFIYKYNKTRKGALISSVVGALCMALICVPINYFIVYPAYVVIYGMPLEAILDMYKILVPAADTLIKALLIFNLPFTFAKGIITSVICFIIYKKISPVLKLGVSKRV